MRSRILPSLILIALPMLPVTCPAAARPQQPQPLPTGPQGDFTKSFAPATPEQAGLDSRQLLALTEWIESGRLPVFSLLVSRHGKLVYELYTSGLDRDAAHYVMSVTKSVVSALVGIAIGERLLAGPDAPIAAALPRRVFASDEQLARFGGLTIRGVLGMAALDAPLPPHDPSPAAAQRQQEFWSADNRLAFALAQPLLPAKPPPFQYNDVTPTLAVGLLQYAAGTTAFEFAEQHLFGPLGFRNAEWMHQDRTGIDLGGYGLRLRPIDMQKLGLLYLRGGVWEGRQVIPQQWIDLSFTPWTRSRPEFAEPNYGWSWWTRSDAKWPRLEANGWKGQRIAVVRDQGLVVTMTACIEDGSEDAVFGRILDGFLHAAVQNRSGAAVAPAPGAYVRLVKALGAARGSQRLPAGIEPRMVPAAAGKETRRPFADAAPAQQRR